MTWNWHVRILVLKLKRSVHQSSADLTCTVSQGRERCWKSLRRRICFRSKKPKKKERQSPRCLCVNSTVANEVIKNKKGRIKLRVPALFSRRRLVLRYHLRFPQVDFPFFYFPSIESVCILVLGGNWEEGAWKFWENTKMICFCLDSILQQFFEFLIQFKFNFTKYCSSIFGIFSP